MPPFRVHRDVWAHCTASPEEAILKEPPPALKSSWFKMTSVPSDTPALDATTRFASGKESISVNLGVFPSADVAKAAMRNMESTILRNKMFLRRGRDLRGLGQIDRKADEDSGTEGIYMMEAAHFHFMRLANVAICTTGLALDDSESPMRPLSLMQSTIEAQLNHLAALANSPVAESREVREAPDAIFERIRKSDLNYDTNVRAVMVAALKDSALQLMSDQLMAISAGPRSRRSS